MTMDSTFSRQKRWFTYLENPVLAVVVVLVYKGR